MLKTVNSPWQLASANKSGRIILIRSMLQMSCGFDKMLSHLTPAASHSWLKRGLLVQLSHFLKHSHRWNVEDEWKSHKILPDRLGVVRTSVLRLSWITKTSIQWWQCTWRSEGLWCGRNQPVDVSGLASLPLNQVLSHYTHPSPSIHILCWRERKTSRLLIGNHRQKHFPDRQGTAELFLKPQKFSRSGRNLTPTPPVNQWLTIWPRCEQWSAADDTTTV